MSRKDFQKGLAAGAQPFDTFYRKLGMDFKDLAERANEKIDNIVKTNEAILNELDSDQKKSFYKNNTIVDIINLPKAEREILLSLLFTLTETEDNINDNQSKFIRSVKNYLSQDSTQRPAKGNCRVLNNNDWSIIDTIEDKESIKAIAQVLMEFLFIGYGNHEDYLDEYEDLFNCLPLSKNNFLEIIDYINNIYRATGMEGIAESYGYTAENTVDMSLSMGKDKYGSSGDLKIFRITDEIVIPDSQTITYENLKIEINGAISVGAKSTLIFKNCHIQNEATSGINLNTLGEVIFENCTIENFHKTPLIENADSGKLIIKNCLYEGNNIFMRNSKITDLGFRQTKYLDVETICEIENSYFELFMLKEMEFFSCGKLKINNTQFHQVTSDDEFCMNMFSANDVKVTNCLFKDFVTKCQLNLSFLANTTSVFYETEFNNCFMRVALPDNTEPNIIKHCVFNDCRLRIGNRLPGRIGYSKSTSVINTRFNNCVGDLFATEMKDIDFEDGFVRVYNCHSAKIEGCNFKGLDYSKYVYANEADTSLIKTDDNSCIIKCNFENIELGGLAVIGVWCKQLKSNVKLSDCNFKNIKTYAPHLISNQYTYIDHECRGYKNAHEKLHNKWMKDKFTDDEYFKKDKELDESYRLTGSVDYEIKDCTGI